MIVVLRGHVRESLDTNELYSLLEKLDRVFDIKLYIQTWSIKQNSLSWRPMEEDNTPVTKELILDYLKGLAVKVKKIIILNENDIVLNGQTEGFIGKTTMPIKGWKYMLAGMKSILDEIYDIDNALLTRFDILKFKSQKYIVNYAQTQVTDDILFSHGLYNDTSVECDNLMLAKLESFIELLNELNHLDEVIQSFPDTKHQECLFPLQWAKMKRSKRIYKPQLVQKRLVQRKYKMGLTLK
jgi:hypothetical protein